MGIFSYFCSTKYYFTVVNNLLTTSYYAYKICC